MVRFARAEVFDPNEVAVAHVYNWTVRRCFLMGDDTVSGKNFDRRKVWIKEYLNSSLPLLGSTCLALRSFQTTFI